MLEELRRDKGAGDGQRERARSEDDGEAGGYYCRYIMYESIVYHLLSIHMRFNGSRI